MTESVLDAAARLLYEYCDNPDISVVHEQGSVPAYKTGSRDPEDYLDTEEQTKLVVSHNAGREPLQRVEDEHDGVALTETDTEVFDLPGGDTITNTSGTFILLRDPDADYSGSVSAASSDSDPEPPATPDEDDDDESAAADDENDDESLTPTLEYGRADRSEDYHVLAAQGAGQFACGATHTGIVKKDVRDEHDSLSAFLEQDDVCRDCKLLLIQRFNIPRGKRPPGLRGVDL